MATQYHGNKQLNEHDDGGEHEKERHDEEHTQKIHDDDKENEEREEDRHMHDTGKAKT